MSHLNNAVLKLCSHLTPAFCQNNRKLILVCDMDETLVTEVHNGEKVIIRPKVCYMLRSLRNLYELCLVTYSTRERTNHIVSQHLDPDTRIFCNRILCREDIVPYFKNKFDAFLAHMPKSFGKDKMVTCEVLGNVNFRNPLSSRSVNHGLRTIRSRRPPAWTYVVALDDFPTAWSNVPTCIPIRPFLVDGFSRSRSYKTEGNYVLSLHKFLTKLHSAVFRDTRTTISGLENPENKSSVDNLRGRCSSAYSVITKIRRRPSQAHRFQVLCHLDPGRLIDFEHRTSSRHRQPRGFREFRTSSSLRSTPTLTSGVTPPYVDRHSPTVNRTDNPDHFTSNCLSYPITSVAFSTGDRDRSGLTENNRSYSCVSPSEQLIRHVHRRARLIPDTYTSTRLI
ncbi:uncharacterized protein DEA37_0014128 [Paragonimus westermani]|uniref:FCP1 homology domain-containing protein n=1 Tax=Paragonimus westermani TaxID=34504 RepID=A0A5J4P001_9TREM|nr:uncharacterized protein DEA37_0014128 [Paragonimus westermani]